jgi:F-type H+-transporting ATPase subunit delta
MKISREARQEARSLYRSCLEDGQLVPERILAVVAEVLQKQPRGYLAIVERIKSLVALEVNRRTHIVRSAVELPDQGASIFQSLQKTFGVPLARRYHVQPELIGGMSVQVGSDIWDGSIERKLRILAPTAN